MHAPLLSLPPKGEASGYAPPDQTKAYWLQQAVPHLSSLFSAALKDSNYAGSVSSWEWSWTETGPFEEPEHRMHVSLFSLPTKEEASNCTLSNHTKLCQQQQPSPQFSLFSVVHRYPIQSALWVRQDSPLKSLNFECMLHSFFSSRENL